MIFLFEDLKSYWEQKCPEKYSKFDFRNQEEIWYCVYKITNISLSKHYIGIHQTKFDNPLDDIGVIYFSSSRDKNFIKDQKENPKNFKYSILERFRNPGDMIMSEVYYHQLYNVGPSNEYYNRKNEHPFGGWGKMSIDSIKKSKITKMKIQPDGSTIAKNSGKKAAITRTKIQPDGSTIAKNSGKKISVTRSKIQASGKTINEESGLKISITANKVRSNGLTIAEQQGKNRLGINHPNFTGLFQTPNGTFDAATTAGVSFGMAQSTILSICKTNNLKIISLLTYSKTNWLHNNFKRESVVGKTWNELGFGFIPCLI